MSQKYSYNLLHESWIPTIDFQGKRANYSIIYLLTNAHNLKTVSDTSPLVEYGIFRFLIAFIMDTFQIVNQDTFEEILAQEKFDSTVILNYASKWNDRFDLFHPTTPFYQMVVRDDKKSQKSISELLHNLPTGNNPIHFYHRLQTQHAIGPEVCARALLTIPAFMVAGGRGFSPSINGIPPWYVLTQRVNLFETLLFNCCFLPIPQNTSDKSVVWKESVLTINDSKKEIASVSTLQGLTFQSRLIHLFPEDGRICSYTGSQTSIVVKSVEYEMGLKFIGEWIDPHISYCISGKGKKAVVPRQNQRLWQNIGPLMVLTHNNSKENGTYYERPLIVTQFNSIKGDRIIDKKSPLLVKVYGLRVDKAKNIEWQQELLGLPLDIVLTGNKGKLIQEAIDFVKRIEKILSDSFNQMKVLKNLNLRNTASRELWNELESRFKEEIIVKLVEASVTDPNAFLEILTDWKKQVCKVASNILHKYTSPIDTSADRLYEQIKVESYFEKKTRPICFVK